MITLDTLKQMAIDDGYVMQPGPYTYLDDPQLRAYVFFEKHIACDWIKLKFALLNGANSCLTPDLSFTYSKNVKAGRYYNIKMSIEPGLAYGKTETATISGSIPFYQMIDGVETQVTSVEVKFLPDQSIDVYCYPVADKAITITITSDSLKQEFTVPWKYQKQNQPLPEDFPRVDSAVVGNAVLM